MSAKKIYWRSREGECAPKEARFFWRPFEGALSPLGPVVQVPLPSPASYRGMPAYVPSAFEWKRNVNRVLESGVQKVVLARRCQVELGEAPNPFAVTAALQKRVLGACLFCVETSEFSLLGASPERLFQREGRRIYTEAVAGTRRRGDTPEEDAALQSELLQSEKDLREIAPVQQFLTEALRPFVEKEVQFTPVRVHKTAHVQHLYSRGVASLKEGVDDALLIEHLHPTPALSGFPQTKAKQMIRALEPFSRGLYGGVLGWSAKERSDWVVLIRCCVLEKTRATLFSGTGIVEGSKGEAEWDELDQKLKIYEGILL